MFDIVEFFKPLLMIWAIFTGGLLFWIILGMIAKYTVKGIIRLIEKLAESS